MSILRLFNQFWTVQAAVGVTYLWLVSLAHPTQRAQANQLIRTDRNGAVAVDHTGKAFPVGRAVKARSKEVKAKLGDLTTLPSREVAHRDAAKLVTDRLKELKDEQGRLAQEKLARWDEEKKRRETRESW